MFKSRKELLDSKKENKLESGYIKVMEDIATDIRNINIDNVDFENRSNIKDYEVIKKSVEYVWTRIFIRNEMDIQVNDKIIFKYIPNSKEINMTFICYAKTGSENVNNSLNETVNYNSEDNKKVLCLMIDNDILKINQKPENMFRNSPYYTQDLLYISDIEIKNERTGELLDFYDIDF